MKMKILAMGIAALVPVGAIAGGAHSGGHDDHDEPGMMQQRGGHHGSGHVDGHHAGGGAGMGHASAVGKPAPADAATRTIEVDLLDTMRFAFDTPLALKQGEAVRFVVINRGQVRHEFSIGSEPEQDAHRAMMRNMPDMVHDDPNTVTVEPGETRELVWRFEGQQPVVFACNIPGHAEAGMVVTARLSP